jgi:sugar phosphate isomerase/epimerase
MAVTILVEALPYSQSNVVHTLDEAAGVVREINSPAVRTMFDCHNAEDETEPHIALIEKNFDLIRHVHVNEMDGRRPGTGDYDFRSLFRALDRLGYNGWISLEIFDFTPDADTVAIESLKYLKSQAETALAA